MQALPWIVALVALMLLAASLAGWPSRQGRRRERSLTLPTEWDLASRPVFSSDERRVYRSLREALPHHVLLPKLPLARFCQPIDPNDAAYWRRLLGASQVSFAICSENGRVLTAIDLDAERSSSRREAQIKRSVLSACRVRYLRCAADQLPSVAELQMLVPRSASPSNAPQPTASRQRRPIDPEDDARRDRTPRPALWQDPPVFRDSFFNGSHRLDVTSDGGFVDDRSARADEGDDPDDPVDARELRATRFSPVSPR